jgi:hypothetical protein
VGARCGSEGDCEEYCSAQGAVYRGVQAVFRQAMIIASEIIGIHIVILLLSLTLLPPILALMELNIQNMKTILLLLVLIPLSQPQSLTLTASNTTINTQTTY